MDGKVGAKLEDTMLVHGVVLDKVGCLTLLHPSLPGTNPHPLSPAWH